MESVSVYALALTQDSIFKMILFSFSIGFWLAIVIDRSKLKLVGTGWGKRLKANIYWGAPILATFIDVYFFIMGVYYFCKDDFQKSIWYLLFYLALTLRIKERVENAGTN